MRHVGRRGRTYVVCAAAGVAGCPRVTRPVLLLCLVLGLLAPTVWGPVSAAFVATTTATASVTTGASFRTYPQAVVADGPIFYHRMDDPSGSASAVDSSGNGRRGVYAPRNYGGIKGLWPLDEGSGAASRDLSGAAVGGVATPNDLDVSTATWGAGQSGAGLSFNGTSQYAASATASVTTSSDFSVSVWVYLADTTVSQTAVSQAGTAASGFEIGYDSSPSAWVFRMRQSDSAAAAVDITSGGTPVLNTWTYLTATLTGTTMRLYVNAAAVGTATTHSSLWNATGAMELGAGLAGTRTRFWSGRVDDVRTYSGSLGSGGGSAVIQELAYGVTGGPSPSWQFNENTGTTVADTSGATNTATLVNGVTWGTGANKKWGTSAGTFDGVDDHAAGRFAAIDTTGAFSVGAWAYLTNTASSRVAVSQDGTSSSAFTLGYDKGTNRWAFEMARTDTASPVYDRATSSSAPSTSAWVHLVGVYDPTATGTELRLYVAGALVGSAARTGSWAATGTAVAGAAKDGSRARYWQGNLDDVQFFSRALGATDITRLTANDPANDILGRSALGVPGALQGAQQGQQASTATANNTARNSFNPYLITNPTTFTLECWFRSSVQGGRALLNFGTAAFGNTGGGGSRRLFVDATGNIGYGQSSGTTISSSGVNYADGAWHHLAATVDSTAGVVLYVDGWQVARRGYTAASNVTGYWRWNGDTFGGTWSSDYNSTSSLDEIAVYPYALSAQQVAWHFYANH